MEELDIDYTPTPIKMVDCGSRKENRIMMIFPFHLKQSISFSNKNKGNFLNKYIDLFLPKWKHDSLINEDTRFFDYIINGFKTNNPAKQETSCLLEKNIEPQEISNLQKVFMYARKQHTGDKLFIQQKQNMVLLLNRFYLEPTKLSICIFDTKVCFFCITYIIKPKTNLFQENEFHDLLITIRRISRSTKMKQFIESILPRSEEMVFFEEKREMKEGIALGDNTIRTILFSFFNIYAKHQDCFIPYWVSRQIVLKRSKTINKTDDIKCHHIVPNNCIVSSTEGCGIINYIDNNLEETSFLRKNIEYYYQHIYLCYMIVLHQYFYLHLLTEEVSALDVGGKSSLIQYCEFRLVEEEYAYFRTKHMFEKITGRNDYQRVYEYLKNSLGIEPFLNEAKYSIEPIQKIADKKVENRKGIFLASFSILALANVIINLYNAFNPAKIGDVFTLGRYIVGFMLIFVILSFWILPNTWIRKLVINEKRWKERKKMKKIEK